MGGLARSHGRGGSGGAREQPMFFGYVVTPKFSNTQITIYDRSVLNIEDVLARFNGELIFL